MNRSPIVGLILALMIALVVHFFTPLLAMLIYELYHILKVEFIYTLYAGLRYASAMFMLWEYRWIVSFLSGVFVLLIVVWRHGAQQSE